MPDVTLASVIALVCLAAVFDYSNGFHDAANSIATVVSTRVLSPKFAVIWAAFFNFVAAFFLGTAVAKTIGKGMIRLDDVTQYVVIAGLLGAIVWDLLTCWWGLRRSSSHALIGGYAGAAKARAALNRGITSAYSVILPQGWTKTLIFIVVAPLIGLAMALIFSVLGYWILQKQTPSTVDTWFRKLQLLSAAAYSLGHGGNDAQKTMGIVAGALYLFGTAMAGISVSNTHTINGAIVGVGAVHRLSAVRWGVARRIVWAWILTIPASAAVAGFVFWVMRLFHPAA